MARLAGFSLVMVLALVGCEGRPGPTSPAERLAVQLVIRAPKTDVNVGETVQLQAVVLYSDGSESPANVQWAATPNAVGTVSSSGVFTGLKLGYVAITAVTPERSGVATFRVINENGVPARVDLSGTWRGQVVVKACDRVLGPGPSPCFVGDKFDFSMSLAQTNYSLSSAIAFGGGTYSYSGNLTGWRDYIGNLVLTGTLSAPDGSGTYEITGWDTRVGPPWAEMGGQFEVVERRANHFGGQVLRLTFEILTLSR